MRLLDDYDERLAWDQMTSVQRFGGACPPEQYNAKVAQAARRRMTAAILSLRIAQHGDFHPATFAAYGHAFVAWQGRIKPPRTPDDLSQRDFDALMRAYTMAQLRAYGGSKGIGNRHHRRLGKL